MLDEFLMVLTGVIIALLCGQMYSGKNARGAAAAPDEAG